MKIQVVLIDLGEPVYSQLPASLRLGRAPSIDTILSGHTKNKLGHRNHYGILRKSLKCIVRQKIGFF
jgi:hypothetical protein